jgi:SAM-dependent methyltransferase
VYRRPPMVPHLDPDPERLYARLYDARGIGWAGELDLYRRLAVAEGCVGPEGRGVLEVACGTGRVALELAADGSRVTGIDLSADMLDIARSKTVGDDPRWSVADMRDFELGERFGLALIPGHSFQFMLTADEQVAALRRIHDHLLPGGLLCVHIDHPGIDWLGSLPAVPGEPEVGRPVVDPATGQRYRLAYMWTYERATQTATAHLRWERLGPTGDVLGRLEMRPMPLHVVGRVEMEHALRRAGFEVEVLLGDFDGGAFGDSSPEMIWLARRD